MAAPFQSVLGTGAMINWLTIENGDVAFFEDWYNFEHLPERVSTSGFLRARRFVARHQGSDTTTDFLTIYETDDVTVLSSPEYLAKLDAPTERTRRVVALFKEFRRSAARLTTVSGVGSTGRVLAVELDADVDLVRLREDLASRTLPRQIAEHRVHVGSLYEPDVQVSAAKAATAEGRSTVSQRPAESPLLLIEPQSGIGPEQVRDGLVESLPDVALPREFDLVFELRAAAPLNEGNPR